MLYETLSKIILPSRSFKMWVARPITRVLRWRHQLTTIFAVGLTLLAGMPAFSLTLIVTENGLPHDNGVIHFHAGGCARDIDDTGKRVMTFADFVDLPAGAVALARGEIVCIVGLGDHGKLGGLTGHEIGKDLNRQLIARRDTHIWIAGCATGSTHQGRSFAQDVIEALSENPRWKGSTVFAPAGHPFCVFPIAKQVGFFVAANQKLQTKICSEELLFRVEGEALKRFDLAGSLKRCRASNRSQEGVAKCMREDRNAIAYANNMVTYLRKNQCTFSPESNGITALTLH